MNPPFLNTSPAVWPACTSDACECGRKPCPTPDACVLPEERRSPFPFGLKVDGQVAAVAVACLVVAAYCLAAN